MRSIHIGVIGAGGRGYISQFAHNENLKTTLVAACDINQDILMEFRKRYGEKIFLTTDYKQLLARKDIDAVLVTTPDCLHEEHAVAALKANKAVYCEKPLAITIEGADNILTTAKQQKQKLFVGHNMRYMPFVIKMKELIDSKVIGDIKTAWCRHFISYGGDAYFKDWHAEQKNTTGLLLQKGCHDIDIIHWLCGAYSEQVSGFGALTVYGQCQRRKPEDKPDTSWHDELWPPLSQTKLNPHIDVEDLSMVQMRLSNGILASYTQCHFSPDAWRNYTFIGTEGRIENSGDFTSKCEIRVWNKRTGFNEKGDDQYSIPLNQDNHGGADQVIIEDFIRFLRDEGKTVSSPIAARHSVATAYQGTMSIRNNSMPFYIPQLDTDIIRYFKKAILFP